METELTMAQFAYFKQQVERLAKLFGLRDWDIVVEKTFDRGSNDQATCALNPVGKLATITLNMWNNDDSSSENVLKSAVHEVLHVLLAELSWMHRDAVQGRDDEETQLSRYESFEHGVINRLSHLLLYAPRVDIIQATQLPDEESTSCGVSM